MPIFDRLFYNRYRREAMSNAAGRLLMIGVGPGTDLIFLPPAVTSVAAVEPEAAFRRMASALAGRRGIAAADAHDTYRFCAPARSRRVGLC